MRLVVIMVALMGALAGAVLTGRDADSEQALDGTDLHLFV